MYSRRPLTTSEQQQVVDNSVNESSSLTFFSWFPMWKKDEQVYLPLSFESNDDGGSTTSSPLISGASSQTHFVWMSVLFSANHACVVAVLSIATAKLGNLGASQSSILYLSYTLSALLGATYVVKRFGARNSLALGMGLYVVYVGCFLGALKLPEDSDGRRFVALLGSAVGGVGAGFLWTAQGAYFGLAAEQHARDVHENDSSTSTSLLAGIFAFIYLAEEVFMRVLSTVLLELEWATWEGILQVYLVVSIASTMLMATVHDFVAPADRDSDSLSPPSSNGDASLIWHKATAATRLLYTDAKLKYLLGLGLVSGLASSFITSYVNGQVLPIALDDPNARWLGLLTSWTPAFAALMSLVFGRWSAFASIGKGPILIVGAFCYMTVALAFVVVPDASRWGWWSLIGLYSCMGVGRATYEGTLKATYVDFFSYEKEGAFANLIIQNGLSSALGFYLSISVPCHFKSAYCVEFRDGSHQFVLVLELCVVLSALAGIIGYHRAAQRHSQERDE
eukprot:Nitzschia sp. Nitz4//scaffold131_size63436//48711//50296//NITZ4_006283-RA/size63436-snap-gene-0.45-mRNA-1//1//CDS//3329535292//9121//frame0